MIYSYGEHKHTRISFVENTHTVLSSAQPVKPLATRSALIIGPTSSTMKVSII